MPTLLPRQEWANAVRLRDKHHCVGCGLQSPTLDAHHIVERRLWHDGGFYLDNGVALCPTCHYKAEQTLLSCEQLRFKAGIHTVLLPEQLAQSDHEHYDKWGNQYLINGLRLKGELFFEEQCQKVFKDAGLLGSFADTVKYPRTLHLPWSPNLHNDDRRIPHLDYFRGQEVVVTTKMDGENTSFLRGKCHARSLDSKNHPSRNWIKSLHAMVHYDIPEGWRICGENLFALHSIPYTDLPSYFLVFNIWNETNACLAWDETVEYCGILGLHTVPVLWRGAWDQAFLEQFHNTLDPVKDEGFVVRLTRRIRMAEYRLGFAKWVRHDHVQTDQFWMDKPVIPNQLAQGQTGFPIG